MGVRVILIVAVVIAGTFAFWHTGGRADAVCMREAFVPADGLSLWPPGARCTYGEPASSDVFFNPLSLAALLVLGLAGGGSWPGARSARPRSHRMPARASSSTA